MRLRIDLAYEGSEFSGWASQPGLRTVQETFESGLATVLRLPEVRVVVAGRTDAGVHARRQVTHLDVDDAVLTASAGRFPGPAPDALVRRLNGILPADLRVHRVTEVPDGFDARFSALWRRYAYRVADRPELVDPLRRHHVLAWPRPLDLDAMNAAASGLVGLQDFAAFCKQREGATTVRTLLELHWDRDETGVATARVVADAFCHHMVRALVGCLISVGEGRHKPEWATRVLVGRVRDQGVTVMHAHGLTLEEVGYPPVEELVSRAAQTRARREPA